MRILKNYNLCKLMIFKNRKLFARYKLKNWLKNWSLDFRKNKELESLEKTSVLYIKNECTTRIILLEHGIIINICLAFNLQRTFELRT